MDPVRLAAAALILGKWAAQVCLSRLNDRHVRRHAGALPGPFEGLLDPATYTKSVQYTIAKGRLHQIEVTWTFILWCVVLFSGVLPWVFHGFVGRFGQSVWATGGFLLLAGLFLSVTGLPFDWYAQFRLEERFGFNTTTQRVWWMDRCKGLLLALVLGYPLVTLILKLAAGTRWWWLWAWGAVLGFELLMVLLAPVFIMPLFNRFTPLPEGSLRERLLGVARRAGFRAGSIQVMDGSKRSRHSNAFFTGFGHLRKIVLFDTLIEQLSESELAAVLAHEIGHYKKGHLAKLLAWTATSLLLGFGALAWLTQAEWFYQAFGFERSDLAGAFVLFGLLANTVTYWLAPLTNLWSRRFEHEADAYAAQTVGGKDALVTALRKLNEKNLSNLTPHPLYSSFYYSHPTLLERERRLASPLD